MCAALCQLTSLNHGRVKRHDRKKTWRQAQLPCPGPASRLTRGSRDLMVVKPWPVPYDSTMRRTLALLTIIMGTTTVAAVEPTGVQHVNAEASSDSLARAAADAIDKATAWLDAHPANVADDELMEVVEEIMFYYALNATGKYNGMHDNCRREIASRHQAIVSFDDNTRDRQFYLQGDWAALTYPPLAYITGRMGLDTDSYRAIIDDLIAHKRHLYPSRITMQLWVAEYLERLGYIPVPSTDYLLNNSSLQQDPETHALLDYFRDAAASGDNPQETVQLVYNITHEIIALTDFGAIHPPPVIVAQHEHYARLIDAAIEWATRESAIDVLAELIFAAHLLELGNLPSLPAALDLIIETQQADGSFGVTNPDRPNGKRHGVLTCLLALKTMGTSVPGEQRPPPRQRPGRRLD